MRWHPANAQTRCRPLRLQVHVQGMRHGVARGSWVCPGKEFVPFPATYEADGITYNLLIVEGKPTWIQQREGGSLGAAGPGGTRAGRPQPGGRHGPGESSSENGHGGGDHHGRRGPAQQAGGHPAADDEALKVRECQEIKVKVQRSLKEAEAQSFQLYHPQVDQAIRKKEELHREPTPKESSARRRRKELVTEEMLDNEMAILAPLQEGMQALPSEEVANEGARALRKVNLAAEPDGGVRPQVHFQVHLLGLDHFPADREDATPGPQCGGLLGQVDGQHPPDEEGGGASPSRAARRNGATFLRRWGRFWRPRISSSTARCL